MYYKYTGVVLREFCNSHGNSSQILNIKLNYEIIRIIIVLSYDKWVPVNMVWRVLR